MERIGFSIFKMALQRFENFASRICVYGGVWDCAVWTQKREKQEYNCSGWESGGNRQKTFKRHCKYTGQRRI